MITSEMITDYVNSHRKKIDEWWALPDHHFSPKIQEHRQKMRFDSWWEENGVRIERNNLHTFSGLVRNNMGHDYYYPYWKSMSTFSWKFRQKF